MLSWLLVGLLLGVGIFGCFYTLALSGGSEVYKKLFIPSTMMLMSIYVLVLILIGLLFSRV